jgi:uncharacterized protein (TIGR03067 family)
MRAAISIVSVLGLSLFTAALSAGKDKEDDAKHLQGAWMIDPASYKDEKNQDRREELSLVRVVFDGESLTFKQPTRYEENGKKGIEIREERGPFRLDGSKNPKQIDLLNEQSGLQAQGIYEIEGAKLKLCWDRGFKARGRPKKFEAGGLAEEPFVVVLVREKKK